MDITEYYGYSIIFYHGIIQKSKVRNVSPPASPHRYCASPKSTLFLKSIINHTLSIISSCSFISPALIYLLAYHTSMAFSHRRAMAYECMRLLYVTTFGVTPRSFISSISAHARSHCRSRAKAVMRLLYVVHRGHCTV